MSSSNDDPPNGAWPTPRFFFVVTTPNGPAPRRLLDEARSNFRSAAAANERNRRSLAILLRSIFLRLRGRPRPRFPALAVLIAAALAQREPRLVRPAGARHEARRLVEQGVDPPDDFPCAQETLDTPSFGSRIRETRRAYRPRADCSDFRTLSDSYLPR